MDKLVIFHFDEGLRAGVVIESLAKQYHFKGYLQCYGFAGYETAFRTNPDVLLLNRLVHIRRRFEQALDENKEMAEHVIRPITLGRKNYLFCGDHEAAANISVICSLLATCKAYDVNPRNYLNDVIARMPYHKKATHKGLLQLPHKWKLQHPKSTLTKQKEEASNRR